MKKGLKKKVVFIGAGNLASSLAPALKDAGYEISQVYSRTRKSAQTLGTTVQANYTTLLSSLYLDADIYILCLKDDAIKKVASSLKLNGKHVFHTSGSVGLKALEGSSLNMGVFYPLQSFSTSKRTGFKDIPVMLEASNTRTYSVLSKLSKDLGANGIKLNSEERLKLHLAAVFACNFTNHFYSIAERLLRSSGLRFQMLYPLILETVERTKKGSPVKFQTGPAARGDKKTMRKHLNILKKTDSSLAKIYKMISQEIMKGNDRKSIKSK